MMAEDMMGGAIEPRDIAGITRVLADTDGRFTALIGAARLHPGRDLRGLDLGAIRIGPEEDIGGYDFSGCCLHGALLCGVDLRKARFAHTDLSGADLRGALYDDAQMKTARLDACQVGDWPERPKRARAAVRLDAVAEAVQAALRTAGDDVGALEAEANAHHNEGRYAIAEALWAIAVDWRAERDGAEDWQTLAPRHNLAVAMLEQGRADEAEAALRALLPVRERVQGAEHPDALVTRHELARAMLDQGRADEAEAAFRALLPVRERVNGAEHPYVLVTRYRLAQAMLDQGRADEAEAAFRALLTIDERVNGAEHPYVLVTRYRLAQAMLDQGRADEAEAMLMAVLESSGLAAMKPHHRSDFALQRARAADALGRIDDGAAFLAEAEAHMAEIPNQNHHVWRAIIAYRNVRIGLVTESERDHP